MTKLFEIPVYALSPGELNSRVKHSTAKRSEAASGVDPEMHELVVE